MSSLTGENVKFTKIKLNYNSFKKPISSSAAEQKIMKMTIDGKEVEFLPGDTIMQVAERAQSASSIPRYCYHPGLPIAGTCRMCTVEVEKMPKLMTSCSTPAAEGMIVHTRSEKVLKSRNGVMEFLLTNHPLDCPVCDKAGECELQDYNYEYGPATSRFKEEKRVFEEATTKKLSDKITLNMNRCVHCERCVRFTDEVTKSYDLVMENRGWKKELCVTDEEKGLWNDYQGNLADFCPVGALTWNDFRFEKRVWFLDKKPSVCDGCSKGCNIEVHADKEVVHRYYPIFNEKVNGHWICDEGRSSYKTYMDPLRIISPLVRYTNNQGITQLVAASWQTALESFEILIKNTKKAVILVGTDATIEEVLTLKKVAEHFSLNILSYNGINGVMQSQDDAAMDHLLIMKDKTPNTRGLESLGVKAASNHQLLDFDLIIYFRSGRAAVPNLQHQKMVFWGVWNQQEIKQWQNSVQLVLPGLSTLEKSGTYISANNITQSFKPAIKHLGGALNVDDVFQKLQSKA
jgi:NADH-quinone oxidoreductase subunit G